MCKHHKTDPTAFCRFQLYLSQPTTLYTSRSQTVQRFKLPHQNRAKRVISFQAANRRAQKLFLLTSPPKPANYGLTRIIQPNLSEQVFLSCHLRDVTHTRQLIVRVGTCITVTFFPRRRYCRSINQRWLPSMGYARRRTALEDWPFLSKLFLITGCLARDVTDVGSSLETSFWSPRSDMATRSTFDLLEQYLASSVTSMTSTFNHPQCTPKTKFHAYWAQNQIYLQIE